MVSRITVNEIILKGRLNKVDKIFNRNTPLSYVPGFSILRNVFVTFQCIGPFFQKIFKEDLR